MTPEHQAAWLGPLAPALVTTGSASRMSHREIPSSPLKAVEVQTEGPAPESLTSKTAVQGRLREATLAGLGMPG